MEILLVSSNNDPSQTTECSPEQRIFVGRRNGMACCQAKWILVMCFILSFSFICLLNQRFPPLPSLNEEKTEPSQSNIQISLDSGMSPPSTDATSHPSTEELLKQYQICRANYEVGYVCKGPAYDNFADKLEALLLDQEQTRRLNSSAPMFDLERKPPLWGKRQHSPFPANTTILALGNSFTRQVFQALFCQYSSLLQHIDMEVGTSEHDMRRGSYYFVEFANHAKLHLVTNSAIFYSKNWPRYLRELIHCDSLQDFDALVVGRINDFQEAQNTTFMELMMEKTAALEDADFSTNPPPTIVDIAELFQGPIVAHTTFNTKGRLPKIYAMVKKVGRENVRLVKDRKYVRFLGECSSDNWQSVGVCGGQMSSHRCIGARGGHPDLVVWDIVEALNDLLLGPRLTSF